MKAADITDEAFLDAVRATRGRWSPNWAMLSDVTEHLDAPTKVVLAKARRLINRGLLGGCACGCRGDFEIVEASNER